MSAAIRRRRLNRDEVGKLLSAARGLRTTAERLAKLLDEVSQRPPRSLSPVLEDMRADARPGCCICCDQKLPPHRSTTCGAPECLKLYQRVYRQGLREAKAGCEAVQ